MKTVLAVLVSLALLGLAAAYFVMPMLNEEADTTSNFVTSAPVQPLPTKSFEEVRASILQLQKGKLVKEFKKETNDVLVLSQKFEQGKLSQDAFLVQYVAESHELCNAWKKGLEAELVLLRAPVWPKELRASKTKLEKYDEMVLSEVNQCLQIFNPALLGQWGSKLDQPRFANSPSAVVIKQIRDYKVK